MQPAGTIEIQGESKLWKLQRVRTLGRGSFGLATLYTDTETSQQLVVKSVHLQRPEDAKQLEAEVNIMRTCSAHPNVVKFLDVSAAPTSDAGASATVQVLMEFCDGGDLAGVIDRACAAEKPLSEDFVLSVLIQLLVAVHYLHTGPFVIHRDLKPANIFLLLRPDSIPVVKVADFGCGAELTSALSMKNTFAGSPFFLSPEVLREEKYSVKVDIWSSGVIAYNLLTLRLPFVSRNILQLAAKVTSGDFERITEADPVARNYDAQLYGVVHSMLQVDAAARPSARRLLRIPYIASAAMRVVPPELLASPFYAQIFGSARLPAAAPAVSHDESALAAEMAAWAQNDAAKDALGDMMVTALVRTQRNPPAAAAAASRSNATVVGGSGLRRQTSSSVVVTTTPAEKDDEYEYEYEDDFEDDIEEGSSPQYPPVSLMKASFDFTTK